MNIVKLFILVTVLLVGLCNTTSPLHGEDSTSMPVVKVVVGQEVLDLIAKWDAGAQGVPVTLTTRPIPYPICFYTPVANPIVSLNGLKPEDVMCWSGELMEYYIDFMDAAGIKDEGGKKVESVMVTGVGNRVFTQDFLTEFPDKKIPKLFFTSCEFQDVRNEEGKLLLEGAARVQFVPSARLPSGEKIAMGTPTAKAAVSPEKKKKSLIERLSPGMTKEEVKQIAGPPTRVLEMMRNFDEVWDYENKGATNKIFRLWFKNGKLTRIQEI